LRLVRNGQSRTLSVTVAELDESLFAQRRTPRATPPAEILRGVELAELTETLRRQFEIPEDADGVVVVTRVDLESPGYSAGLREGSLILEAQLRPVTSVEDVAQAAGQSESGRLLLRVCHRDGTVSYLVVTR
jgi:serine protease Do